MESLFSSLGRYIQKMYIYFSSSGSSGRLRSLYVEERLGTHFTYVSHISPLAAFRTQRHALNARVSSLQINDAT